jgi:hypothetical protein
MGGGGTMIVGAGLAGLIAAHMFPRMDVCEAGPPVAQHQALLRFRSEKVSHVTGIPFRRVRVHKGIWVEGAFTAPNIRLANMYSMKCLGSLIGDRSIWNIEPVDRFIAPNNFYEQMVDHVGHRIAWSTRSDFETDAHFWISTAPLNVTLKIVGIEPKEDFKRSPITVKKYHIPGADVFQTIYFPSQQHNLYRASMTGDTLICEFINLPIDGGDWEIELALAFGFIYPTVSIDAQYDLISESRQHYGKIAPIDDSTRKAYIATLTNDHNIFSLGRFATWRNLLLDDVVDDVAVVRRLMTSTTYERKLKQ